METFFAQCREKNFTGARSTVHFCRLSNPRLTQFSSNDKVALNIYFVCLYEAYGNLAIRKILQSGSSSPSLLMYLLKELSANDSYNFQKSDQCIAVCAQYFLERPIHLISNNEWVRRRLQMKKDLGVIVQGLWKGGLTSTEMVLSVCTFHAFAFTPTELRILVTGFAGKENDEPGYRRITLQKRKKGKLLALGF